MIDSAHTEVFRWAQQFEECGKPAVSGDRVALALTVPGIPEMLGMSGRCTVREPMRAGARIAGAAPR